MASSSFQSLLSELNSEQKSRLEKLLLENQLACLDGTSENQIPQDLLQSRIGGKACLPKTMSYPCDRSGREMVLVALVNFADLPPCNLSLPTKGVFMLFCNAALDFSNPKDRHAFNCVWLPEPLDLDIAEHSNEVPELGPPHVLSFEASYSVPLNMMPFGTELNGDMSELLKRYLIKDQNKIQILGSVAEHFDILQEIAAFSGNGVSWSPARRKDSCFSHLVDNAREWRLFLQLRGLPEYGLDLGNKSMNLMIRQEDLEAFRFEKAWLVVA